MRTRRLVLSSVAAATAISSAAVAMPPSSYQRPGRTERVSVSSSGAQGNSDSPDYAKGGVGTAMTPDGRFVAFASTASNLDTSGPIPSTASQVFVRDRLMHTTSLVSVALLTDGVAAALPPACSADEPAISADGRYVAFTGSCNNHVQDDVFVRDVKLGLTTRVSVASNGGPAIGSSWEPTISADGRVVAFQSTAKNLVPPTCNDDPLSQAECTAVNQLPISGMQVYARDLRLNKTVLVSVSTSGGVPNGQSFDASVSPDGRFVAFSSVASNVAPNDTNVCNPAYGTPSCPDEFLRDLTSGKTEIISVGLNGQTGSDESGRMAEDRTQAISADDRYVTFTSFAPGLVPNTAVSYNGIYVRDRRTGRTARVSVDGSGTPLGVSEFSISPDGRFVAMASLTGQVACGPGQPSPGVIGIHDQVTGALDFVGREAPSGAQISCADYFNASDPQISGGGTWVSFISNGASLVAGDTNKKTDVFVRNRGTALGAGGLAGAGKLSVAGERAFANTGMVTGADTSADVNAVLTAQGANLIGASLVYRPQYADLFVRLELQQMPMFALANPAMVYGLDLTVGKTCYQLRIAKTGLEASYGLFRLDGGDWTHVADVRGGYGTTGQEVVAALPLADIGATSGAHLSNVEAFTGLGSWQTGAIRRLDDATL